MRRHETDVTSLVFGLIFLGLAVLWPLVHADVIGWLRLGVLVPILLIGAGIIGLVASIRSSRHRRNAAAVEAPPEPIDESPIDVTADIADALARERAKQATKKEPGGAAH